MSLENIISKILQDAETKALAIKSEAAAGAALILKEAEKKGTAVYSEIINSAQRRAGLEKRRSQVNREIAYKKDILSQKQSLIEEAFKTAKGQLLDMDDDKYLSLIKDMLISCTTENSESIVISKRDQGRITGDFIKSVKNKFANKLKIKVEDRFKDGGFVLEEKNIRINLSFSSALDDLKEDAIKEIADILFKTK